jgi:hypothetical protein
MENWNYVYPASRGVIARDWNYNFSNGLGRGVEQADAPGVLVFNDSRTEEAHRARLAAGSPSWRPRAGTTSIRSTRP